MKIINNPPRDSWKNVLQRPTQTIEDIEATVSEIFTEVEQKGDAAVVKYTSFFDGILLKETRVSEDEITQSINEVSNELIESINLAKSNVEKFHKAQVTVKVAVDTMEGVSCWQEKRAIEKVGLYIPGGTAPLFSTVLMLAIPATLAGCKRNCSMFSSR